MSKLEIWQFIKIGSQKTQSFSSGRWGEGREVSLNAGSPRI